MGEKWRRDVRRIPGDNPHLEITTPDKGNPHGRTDSPTIIKVKKADRKDGGAEVVYQSQTQGLQLIGLTLDPPSIPSGLTVEVRGGGEMLWLTDKGGKGDCYNYRILASYDGTTLESPDPEIHNEDE